DAIYRLDHAVIGVEAGAEITDGKQRLRHRYLDFGSRASRRPSPRKLKESVERKIITPGARIQRCCSKVLRSCAAFSMFPQEETGSRIPRPRNESPASASM